MENALRMARPQGIGQGGPDAPATEVHHIRPVLARAGAGFLSWRQTVLLDIGVDDLVALINHHNQWVTEAEVDDKCEAVRSRIARHGGWPG